MYLAENGNGSVLSTGGFGLFLMAIFLVVLFSMFCRGRGYGNECNEGCADKLTYSRYANYVDPEIMRNHIEQTRDTGNIRKDIATENGEIKASIDRQTKDIQLIQERTAGNIILGQAAIAREQERMFYQGQINAKDEKLAEQRERNAVLEGRLMQAESAREADRRQWETMAAMGAQYNALASRIGDVECKMLKAPEFFPYGGIASVNLCGYRQCGGGCNNNNG